MIAQNPSVMTNIAARMVMFIVRQEQDAAGNRQNDHDPGNRIPRHKRAEQDDAEQGQHGCKQGQDREKLLIEIEDIDLKPGQPRARARHGAKHKDDDRCANDGQPLPLRQQLNQPF